MSGSADFWKGFWVAVGVLAALFVIGLILKVV